MTFEEAFDKLLGHEGGYVNNPSDPGGETKWGISKRSYPQLNIKDLTKEDAAKIYYADFWQPLRDAPSALRFQAFDFAVNSGVSTAIRKLQQVLGVADDGHWGPVSAAALAKQDIKDVFIRYGLARLKFYAALSTFSTFGKGWTLRVVNNLELSLGDLK